MKKFLCSFAVASILSITSANAITFDFADLADTQGEGNWNDIVSTIDDSAAGGTAGDNWWTVGGLGVYAHVFNGTGLDPYLDAGNAGLGVCSTVSGCAGISDDNVTSGEAFDLDFDVAVTLSDLLFRNQGHNPLNGTVEINGVSAVIVAGMVQSGGDFSQRTFWNFKNNGSDFYLSSANAAAVPIPAPLALFLTGLVGLGIIGRRRKQSAV